MEREEEMWKWKAGEKGNMEREGERERKGRERSCKQGEKGGGSRERDGRRGGRTLMGKK